MASTIEDVEVGARLRLLRMQSDLSQRQFADWLGISLRAYQNYERGERRIPADVVLMLSKSAGINQGWLLSGTGPQRDKRIDSKAIGSPIPQPDGDRIGCIEFYIHPNQLFGDEEEVKLSAMNVGERGDIQDIIQSVGLEPKYVRNTLKVNPHDACIVYIEDAAMQPTLNKGDIVLIDEGDRQVSRDALFAIHINNRVMVRRLQVRPGNAVQIISDNPAFPAYTASLAEGKTTMQTESNAINVLGRVVWKGCAV